MADVRAQVMLLADGSVLYGRIVTLGEDTVLIGQTERELVLNLLRVPLDEGEEIEEDSVRVESPFTVQCRLILGRQDREVYYTPSDPYGSQVKICVLNVNSQLRPSRCKSHR